MNNIKRARLNRELAQKQVAIELGVAQATVSEWESGKSMPTSENLKKLAQLFFCTTDYLLEISINNPENEKAPIINDEELKFALWGDEEVDDDILDDVKTYARIKREMDKQKKV